MNHLITALVALGATSLRDSEVEANRELGNLLLAGAVLRAASALSSS